jgi:hypothetical protein
VSAKKDAIIARLDAAGPGAWVSAWERICAMPQPTCAACGERTTGEFGLIVAGAARVICGGCADDASDAALGREAVVQRILDAEDIVDGYEPPCAVTHQACSYPAYGVSGRCADCNRRRNSRKARAEVIR